jgi:hypothetical protein
MKHMAGRKRHSAEDIVRKLRRADVDRPRWRSRGHQQPAIATYAYDQIGQARVELNAVSK